MQERQTDDAGRLRFVGHATALIQLDGVRLLTDPVLRGRVAHLRRSPALAAPARPEVDAVLLSHAHRDHLDLPSLDRLGRSMRIVVPRGVGALLRRRGFERVEEVEPGQRIAVGAVHVEATPAEHAGGRGLLSSTGETIGFAVLGSRRLLFFGDTDLFDGMDGLVADLDVALLPIWGWGPTLGRGSHLDPERAVEALQRLRPRIAVPVHWGTLHPAHRGLRRPPAFLSEPAAAFARAAAVVAPDVEVRVLRPGEETVF